MSMPRNENATRYTTTELEMLRLAVKEAMGNGKLLIDKVDAIGLDRTLWSVYEAIVRHGLADTMLVGELRELRVAAHVRSQAAAAAAKTVRA